MKPKCVFILSVDTEEEWDWDGPFPQSHFSVTNAQELPGFHEFCRTQNIRPTYFVDHAVLNDVKAASVIRGIMAFGGAEVGAHLHPWCNPPYYGNTDELKSHVVNLPLEQTKQKLIQLTQKIKDTLYIQPQSFRTGRWGINGEVIKLLVEQGYKVDSSVYPFYRNDYFDCDGAGISPYYPNLNDVTRAVEHAELVELPVSAGFNRTPFEKYSRWHRALEAPALQYLRPVGALWRLGLLRKIYLSPELTTSYNMIKLVKAMLKTNHQYVHMYFHSSSLIPGASGIAHKNVDSEVIRRRIEQVVRYLQAHTELSFRTVTEAAEQWQKGEL